MIHECINLKKLVDTHVNVIPPKNLIQLSKDLHAKRQRDYPTLISSYEFPPKPIDKVIRLFLGNEHEALNFFDVVNLMRMLREDSLHWKALDRDIFSQQLQNLFIKREPYIKQFLLKSVASILIKKNDHSFKVALNKNLNTHEFNFLKLCLSQNLEAIHSVLNNDSLRKKLEQLSLVGYFKPLIESYIDFLILNLRKKNFKQIENLTSYENNLLDIHFTSLESSHRQLESVLAIIENNQGYKDLVKLEVLINQNLGEIQDDSSGWYIYQIPEALINRYKALKGLFEFRSFLEASKFLSQYSTNFTDDKERDFLLNRALFWSNYESRFASVKMWINNNDKSLLEEGFLGNDLSPSISLNDIKKFNLLSNFNNEACLFEFHENLMIFEFFRKRDANIKFTSMIFEYPSSIEEVKDLLELDFSLDIYKKIKMRAKFCINHDFMWQGWVDFYLRERGVFPDESILKGAKKFTSNKHVKVIYGKNGLQETRKKALNNERKVTFDDVVSRDFCRT